MMTQRMITQTIDDPKKYDRNNDDPNAALTQIMFTQSIEQTAKHYYKYKGGKPPLTPLNNYFTKTNALLLFAGTHHECNSAVKI
eukprot:597379-Amphidinium_carterae.1